MTMLFLQCRNIRSLVCSRNALRNIVRCSSTTQDQDISTKVGIGLKSKSKLFPEYTPVYNFNRIFLVSLLHRSTKIGRVVIPTSIIVSAILAAANIIPVSEAIGFSLTGIALLLWLHYMCSKKLSNIVGIIYYDKDKNKAIISYLNSQGTRINCFVEPKDVVPIVETNEAATFTIYRKLCIKNPELTLRLHLGPAATLNTKSLEHVIGPWE